MVNIEKTGLTRFFKIISLENQLPITFSTALIRTNIFQRLEITSVEKNH